MVAMFFRVMIPVLSVAALLCAGCETTSPKAEVAAGAAIRQDVGQNLTVLDPCEIKPVFLKGEAPSIQCCGVCAVKTGRS